MQSSYVLGHALRVLQATQAYLGMASPRLTPDYPSNLPTFAFSEHWQLLGPFQIGTREAQWGADPTEQYGGFRSLDFEEEARFPSSLPFNATVSWSQATAKLGDPSTVSTTADLSVEYSDVDWSLLQQVYGWAALQWQGWARGEICIQTEDTAVLVFHAENVLEYWIDGKQYFGGDVYGYHRAPSVLRLDPGIYQVDIRLVRDVRAMGGIAANHIDVKLELRASYGDLLQEGKVLIADRIEGEAGLLASSYSSVVLRNSLQEDIRLESVQPESSLRNMCKTLLVSDGPIKIAPGQSRPVAFRVACVPDVVSPKSIDVEFRYRLASQQTKERIISVTGFPKTVRDKYLPQKITYLHPGGMVSYAILRPPSRKASDKCNATTEKLPILLALHGAGLEADDDLVRHALAPLPDLCAWVLFPTGVTPWSGDDWHNWGFADIEAAVRAIPEWIKHNSWAGPDVDIDSWLISGHSNGGQGAWYGLLHHHDKIIAAAPLSGYSSIQNYVPYELWRPAEPRRGAILHSSLNSYRHELLLGNAQGIPIYQQHGSADDNVPAYHSRLMHQLLWQNNAVSTYHEMKSKPHYWDGVMTTQPLSDFWEHQLSRFNNASHSAKTPHNFTVVSANPADTGSKNGVRILALRTPGQLGIIEVKVADTLTTCVLFTSNVRLIELPACFTQCDKFSVDDSQITMNERPGSIVIDKASNGNWRIVPEDDRSAPSILRHGRQLGPIDSILRTQGAFQIVFHPSQQKHAVEDIALQISRNLCQYYYADTELSTNISHSVQHKTGNIISVTLGAVLPHEVEAEAEAVHHAIILHDSHIRIRDATGTVHIYRARDDGLAAIFLRPLPNERLELVVWGADEASLRVAARLVPLMTGAGVPDFVLADKTMSWKGLDGTLAMGFFDEEWNASVNSFFS